LEEGGGGAWIYVKVTPARSKTLNNNGELQYLLRILRFEIVNSKNIIYNYCKGYPKASIY
jgi:hypothetical protein